MKQPYKITSQKVLTLAEEREVRKQTSKRVDRDSVLLWLALETGARAQELLNIDKKDINLEDSSVLIRGIKNSNDRELPIPKALCERLINVIVRGETKPFPITYNRLFQIWDERRPVKKGFHSLRHSFAVRQYERTRDIMAVKHALGHKGINNTLVYLEFVNSKSVLKQDMKARETFWAKELAKTETDHARDTA